MNFDTGNVIAAFILGIVEGITEFLPVSSTGHLIIVGNLIHFTGSKANSFEVFIQLGAILAVVVLFYKRFTSLLDFSVHPSGATAGAFSGFRGIIKISLACIPALAMGALFHKQIKTQLFFPIPVAIALIAGGIVMMFIDKDSKRYKVNRLEEISYQKCFLLGLFQCLALWPGISRSGSMIVGGLILGCRRVVAAEFSFLVAVPIMFAASILDLWKSRYLLETNDIFVYGTGFVVSFIMAILAIKVFLKLLEHHTLRPFGVYRIVLGVAVILFFYF